LGTSCVCFLKIRAKLAIDTSRPPRRVRLDCQESVIRLSARIRLSKVIFDPLCHILDVHLKKYLK
jgi:hypothetical protein